MSKVHEAMCPEKYGDYETKPVTLKSEEKSKEKYKPVITPTLYWQQYERVLHCCGRVASYARAYDGLERGSPTFNSIATEYDHDESYYDAKTQKWIKRRNEALHIFNATIMKLDHPYVTKKTGRELLFSLTYNPDYRACCYDALEYGKKKDIILTLAEIDERYNRRLKKRSRRKK